MLWRLASAWGDSPPRNSCTTWRLNSIECVRCLAMGFLLESTVQLADSQGPYLSTSKGALQVVDKICRPQLGMRMTDGRGTPNQEGADQHPFGRGFARAARGSGEALNPITKRRGRVSDSRVAGSRAERRLMGSKSKTKKWASGIEAPARRGINALSILVLRRGP